ncbi:MAG: type IV pilus modification protein PilV [Candidatus Polarisedimenticolaceae bacterium]|nr:type IV pilus modification protein PilV [Candidatus Polarisedimenticolaceae bacterium]
MDKVVKSVNFNTNNRGRAGCMAGFSLIEVLVALMIFSLGILGLSGLQFTALRGNHDAYINTIASIQVMDAADRILANPGGVAAGNYDLLDEDAVDPGCIAVGCSPADLAQYDYWVWNTGDAAQPGTGNATQLPQGEGVICLDATPDDGVSRVDSGCDGALVGGDRVFAIKIWWDDDGDPGTASRRHVLSVFP